MLIAQLTRLIPDAKGTKCNQELEPIKNTKHSHILRVPFRTEKGVLNQWVSRFDIYPYLERYTQVCIFISTLLIKDVLFPQFHFSPWQKDAADKIVELMEGKPDLIIGNYTDGNLVASLMARKLGITLVTFLNHI